MSIHRGSKVKVKFQDLSLINEPMIPVWEPKFREIVRNSQFILGPHLKEFESNFAKYIGTKHCIGVNNGTSALTIALQALKLKYPHIKNVAVQDMTFAATIEAIHNSGLTPVLVDILPSGQMNFDHLNRIRKTVCIDAVIVVHLCGTATFIPAMDIPVIEDSCQSVGSEINGRKTGSVGNIAAFSFYSGKNLGALGDGGAITTSDDELNKYCSMLRNHGCETKYKHDLVGWTARLDNLQAMFLNTKLPNLDAENEQRCQVASWYYESLLTSNVRNYLDFQTKETSKRNNFHLFVVKSPVRDKLSKFLNDNGIETGLHYPEPLHRMKANQGKYLNRTSFNEAGEEVVTQFPESDKWANQCLSLPMHPNMEHSEVLFVCDKIKEFFK